MASWSEILFGKSSSKSRSGSGSLFSSDDLYDDEHTSYHSSNLSDRIERESWLDELDRSSADDPWDSDNDRDY